MILKDVFRNILYYGLESIGKYYSSYRGYVVNNEDPDGLGRIQIKIPTITRNQTHPEWAYPKTQWGGNNYGMQLLPAKGEMIWVEFEHGDTRFPIWSFAHRAKGEKPEEFINAKVYGFRSPRGQTIIIDDREGEEKIVINHGDNNGLVKVIELTEMLNKNEKKMNDLLSYIKNHVHIDPVSGFTGQPFFTPTPFQPLGTQDLVTPVPRDVDKTEEEYIENTKVQH